MKEILVMRDKTDKYTTKKEDIFDLPMRLLVVGGSGMGKSSLALGNFLLRESFYKNDFEPENIFIFSGSLSEQKLKTIVEQLDIPESNLFNDYKEHELEAVYNMLVDDYNEAIEKKEKPKNTIIYLDDLGYKNMFNKSSKNNQIDRLYCNGRKYLISSVLILQRYTQTSTCVRSNITGLILGKVSNKELELVERDLNYLPSKKAFFDMVRKETPEKHDFMIFNLSNDKGKNIYQNKNFQTINIV
jgi:hypothetical protein